MPGEDSYALPQPLANVLKPRKAPPKAESGVANRVTGQADAPTSPFQLRQHSEPAFGSVARFEASVEPGISNWHDARQFRSIPFSPSRPLKVSFILNTFTFGGSETETIELVCGADPSLLRFGAIAVLHPLPLPDGEPRKDGSFPPLYMCPSPRIDVRDPRIRLVESFEDAVRAALDGADFVITWGIPNLFEYLPLGRLPRIIVMSKDSGEWAKSFLLPNSWLTRHYVANSSLAAGAFPEPARGDVKVIHNGFNPQRVKPKISRLEQRRHWNLSLQDKVVGYIGRIERDKGMHRTVEGIARLPEEWKAVFIGVTGNSSYADEFRRLCQSTIPGRYRLLGWCHDLGSALAGIDVFSHPSDHEGFSNSIGEAWLAGVPTVYTGSTGAIPDLGDLGIPVPQDADGAEIERALLTAYGNVELATHAKETVKASFLVEHNIKRWTDHLFSLKREPRKHRILAMVPWLKSGRVATWLASLMTHCESLDVCRILQVGRQMPPETGLEDWLNRRHKCPVSVTNHDRADIETIVRSVRPDLVLTTGIPHVEELLRPSLGLPVVDVRHYSSHSDHVQDWPSTMIGGFAARHMRYVAVTTLPENYLHHKFEPHVRVIAPGVEIAHGAPGRKEKLRKFLGLSSDDIALGFVGRLGIDVSTMGILRSLRSLSKRYRPIFIGPLDRISILDELRSLAPRSIHVPAIPPEELYDLLPGLDALAHANSDAELPLSVLEAWASRIPVISTPSDMIEHAMRDCGARLCEIIGPNADAHELSRALKSILHPSFEATVDQAYRYVAARYSAETARAQWMQYVAELLETHAH